VPSGKKPETVAKLVRHILYLQQGIDADVETMQVQVDAANSVIDTFISVLGWVALICMLVGGIGVMNILLVGVRERRREIGIMQSLGANRTEITLLFLWEAMIYALLGGVLGIVMGIILTNAAGRSIDLTAVIQISDCITVLAAAICTGLFFGVTPALKASGLKPVDALRSE
jgi:putative ABC transport system permease protein